MPPALVSDMILNDRTIAPSHDVRGGILVPESVRVEDRDGDSFGGFAYRNYFGALSTWTRETILTREGYLIVRDIYTAGEETDGYRVGPVWCLRADGKWIEGKHANGQPWRKFENAPPAHDGKQNWFDAPAFDHAWWQSRRKRVLVYVHAAADQTYGQLQHRSTPDFSRDIYTNSSWAASIVKAGRPRTFLTVLLPFDDGGDVSALLGDLETEIDESGDASVRVGDVNASLRVDGQWFVKR
jgi:hypothetical protein